MTKFVLISQHHKQVACILGWRCHTGWEDGVSNRTFIMPQPGIWSTWAGARWWTRGQTQGSRHSELSGSADLGLSRRRWLPIRQWQEQVLTASHGYTTGALYTALRKLTLLGLKRYANFRGQMSPVRSHSLLEAVLVKLVTERGL
jgi:phage gp37-like protein